MREFIKLIEKQIQVEKQDLENLKKVFRNSEWMDRGLIPNKKGKYRNIDPETLIPLRKWRE